MGRAFLCLAAALSTLVLARPADAQIFESVGVRAQGMGGAFVALADDATATWWNPAGIVTGPYFDALFDYGRLEASEQGVKALAVAFPALGLSYYRIPVNQIQSVSPTGTSVVDRQEDRALSVLGVTVAQSVGQHLARASSLKLDRSGDTAGDLDIGALARLGWLRLGLTAKNLRKPTLTDDSEAITLERQVRAGLALVGTTRGLVNRAAL